MGACYDCALVVLICGTWMWILVWCWIGRVLVGWGNGGVGLLRCFAGVTFTDVIG